MLLIMTSKIKLINTSLFILLSYQLFKFISMGNNICCQDSHQVGQIEKLEKEVQINKVALHHHHPHEEKKEEEEEEEEQRVQNSLDHLVQSHHEHHPPELQVLKEEEEEENVQIPQLYPKAKQTIEEKDFFAAQFSAIPRSYTRKYGDDVYVGELDEQKVRPNGLGKMYKSDGSIYLGHFQHGRAHGRGAFVFQNGSYYDGQFQNNKAETSEGFGQYRSQHLRYDGEFRDNKFHGKGKEVGDHHSFEGSYENGSRTHGVLKWKAADGDYQYTGPFNHQNKFEGEGTLIEPSGVYKGHFENGQKHGKGQYTQTNGARYVGDYAHNQRTGYGTIYNSDNTVAYKGNLVEGLPHGKGVVTQGGKEIQVVWDHGIDSSIIDA